MTLEFYKYEGAGNDFVMIDNRKGTFSPEPERISRLCNRNFGIGADGLILLEDDTELDFSMRYFNADGNEGSMCGNGGRCIVWFAKNSGFQKSEFDFRAIDGLHRAEIISHNGSRGIIRLQMKNVSEVLLQGENLMIDTGSPHLLIPVESVDDIDVYGQGKKIRYSEAFREKGINVNFIKISGRSISLRTYERGVENETLACGTGAVASALAAMSLDVNLLSPLQIKAKGGILKVFARRESQGFSDIWLEGPATSVFKGEIGL
ncbi:MAG: diaminopimelate epimerase [Bacteroidales bacterium]|nr:diaminopimelate epimerase [Bacteroidales bacterium]